MASYSQLAVSSSWHFPLWYAAPYVFGATLEFWPYSTNHIFNIIRALVTLCSHTIKCASVTELLDSLARKLVGYVSVGVTAIKACILKKQMFRANQWLFSEEWLMTHCKMFVRMWCHQHIVGHKCEWISLNGHDKQKWLMVKKHCKYVQVHRIKFEYEYGQHIPNLQ